jgi:hypothetical protein
MRNGSGTVPGHESTHPCKHRFLADGAPKQGLIRVSLLWSPRLPAYKTMTSVPHYMLVYIIIDHQCPYT